MGIIQQTNRDLRRQSTNQSNHEGTLTKEEQTNKNEQTKTMALLVPDFFDHIFADLHDDVVDLSSCKKVCRPRASRMSWPKIDVTEEEDKFLVYADVPGVPKDKLKVDIKDNGITLSFDQEEKKEETTQQGKTIRKERYYSAFTRTLPIPKWVDKENISAAYTDGVLTLALPKARERSKVNHHRMSEAFALLSSTGHFLIAFFFFLIS